MKDDTPPETAPAVVGHKAELVPQPHGGKLRRGNPGNRGPSKSALARELLEKDVPKVAAILRRAAIEGKFDTGEKARRLSDPDRLKALTAYLDRAGVPPRTEVTGADGAPFTLLVLAQKAGD